MNRLFKNNSISIGTCLGIKSDRAFFIETLVDEEYKRIVEGDYEEEQIPASLFVGRIIERHKIKSQKEVSLICWLCGVLFGKLEVITNHRTPSYGKPVG